VKPLGWVGSAKDDLLEFPDSVVREIGHATCAEIVYVLHAFQKKSRRGIATPRQEIERVRTRLRQAEQEYQTWQSEKR
jgi:phage-related protein